MAEETNDDKQQPAAVLVLVVMEKKKEEEEQLQQARAVRFVCYWALFNATMFAFSFAVDYALSPMPCDHDPAEVEFDDAVEARCMIWCFVLQAAAATLALLLAGRRRKTRLALAYAALAAAAVCHCMLASVIGRFLAQDPGHLLLRVGGALANFVYAGTDLLCFLGLLLAGGGEE